nr:hypothetical protein [Rathayibacter rathayi]
MKRAALIGTVLWALFQCFGNLSAANVFSDEPVYLAAGWDYLHGDVSANREHPPVAKYLIGLAQVLLGDQECLRRRLCKSDVLRNDDEVNDRPGPRPLDLFVLHCRGSVRQYPYRESSA